MPWSIFTQGGGQGAAVTWAQDELQLDSAAWGVNVDSPGAEQFIYDWELAEGGGGANNPLNQGPVPGHPELTTTGSQYGGGAADFASVQAGLQGTLDYLNMPAYSGIKAALEAGDPAGARSALIASPWAASHYGGGANFPTNPLPGQASAITGSPGPPTTGGTPADATTTGASLNPVSDLTGSLKTAFGYIGLVLAGAGLVVLGVWKAANPGTSIRQLGQGAAKTAAVAA